MMFQGREVRAVKSVDGRYFLRDGRNFQIDLYCSSNGGEWVDWMLRNVDQPVMYFPDEEAAEAFVANAEPPKKHKRLHVPMF